MIQPRQKVLSKTEALAWIAEALNEPIANVQATARRPDLPGWDSLGHLVLISGLDQQFGIKLNQKELSALASVQDVLDVLARHGRLHDA